MKNTTTARRLLAGAAAALCLAVGVGPAGATGNAYTVYVGGNSASASHHVTLATVQSVQWASPTLNWTCSSASTPATPAATVQAGTAVTDVVRFPRFDFVGCHFPGGALAATTAGDWLFHGTSAATSGQSDVVTGHLDDISITWRNAVCQITVTGRASASVQEATQRLLVDESGFTGSLRVSRAIGCLGQVRQGQVIDLRATFSITSPDGSINIG